MDSMEINKAFAAVLTAGIAFMGAGLLSDALIHPKRPERTVIKVEGVEVAAAPQQAPQGGPVVPIANLMATADVGAGETASKRLCTSCHSFNEGGKAAVGPNLYGIMGARHGHQEGFAYSAALKGKEGPWTYEDMSAWLLNPRGYAPGTKMAFAGIANDKQRADVIAYLRSLSKNPIPLPEAQAQPAAVGGAAPQGGQGGSQGGGAQAAGQAGTETAAPGTPGAAPAGPSGGTPVPAQSGGAAPTGGGTRVQGGQVQGRPSANPGGEGTGVNRGTPGQNSQPNVSMNQSQAEQNQSQQPAQATPSR